MEKKDFKHALAKMTKKYFREGTKTRIVRVTGNQPIIILGLRICRVQSFTCIFCYLFQPRQNWPNKNT